jgi:putative transposase
MPGLRGIRPSSSSGTGSRAASYHGQCAQLTGARAEYDWLAAGSQTVQQQALRDFAQAMRTFSHRTHRRHRQVWVPKVGWVRFRWTRIIRATAKSDRVSLDRAGRWHIAVAVIPKPVPGPGDGSVVSGHRGAAVSVALSCGELLRVPGLGAGEAQRPRRLQRRLARARRGSNRRARTKRAIARLRARETDRRRDWVEKTTTDVARRFHTVRVEDLNVPR